MQGWLVLIMAYSRNKHHQTSGKGSNVFSNLQITSDPFPEVLLTGDSKNMIVKLKHQAERQLDLTIGQPYAVIGIEADDLRILNDHGQPYLYPSDQFEVLDTRQSPDWIVEMGADGERYAYPPPLNRVGFFEDFFDANEETIATFWRIVNQRLTLAAAD